MLPRKNFSQTILAIFCILCFNSISLAQLGWETKAPMPTARGWLSTCAVDGYIYAIGGALDIGSNLDAMEEFNPLTNTWTTKTPMPTPRGCAAACAVDGIIYVFGGGWYTVYSTVEAYNPQTDTWTTKSPMPTARSGLSVCEVDGIIYAISGFTDMNNPLSTNTVEAYNPKTDTWTTKAPIPTVRAYFATSVVNNIIYTFGGFNGRATPSLGNVEAYDPSSNVWTVKNDMPNPKAGMASYAYGGNIYCFGGVGYGGGPTYSTISKYDPAADSWEEFSNMPYSAFSISSSLLNGKLYFIGGLNNARTPLDIVYEIDPQIVLPVPVELISFTAATNGKEVTLSWATATEINNQGFEIQRKFGSNDFITVGSVKGHGTTTSPNQYSYVDKLADPGKYFYRLKQNDYGGTFEYSNEIEVEVRAVDKFTLEQNYPNPFNPTTTIGYVLQEKSNAKLTLLNALGEEIAVLVNEVQDKGYHKVELDGSRWLTSGVYFYQLKVGPSSSSEQIFVETKKMILMK